jgi:peptidoglycan/LPS O-acetylase OafA/YrhL
MVFAALAISIFSAWIFYLFIEKPAIKWAKQIKYKEKDKSP